MSVQAIRYQAAHMLPPHPSTRFGQDRQDTQRVYEAALRGAGRVRGA